MRQCGLPNGVTLALCWCRLTVISRGIVSCTTPFIAHNSPPVTMVALSVVNPFQRSSPPWASSTFFSKSFMGLVPFDAGRNQKNRSLAGRGRIYADDFPTGSGLH
ncbi:hypothetical protein D3C81_1601670 [compost metagenome]